MLNHIIAEGRLCPAVRHDANTPPRAVGETPYVSAWDVTLQAGSRDSAADLDRWGGAGLSAAIRSVTPRVDMIVHCAALYGNAEFKKR
ncbi:hypothetical protein ABWK57_32475, partial [Streptomyces sp. NPDC094045]|uniref:hypothetical protein n=1 Tax=Streptomyces sp. NPDC094045 TaxID=3161019 RepID=UPI0033985648